MYSLNEIRPNGVPINLNKNSTPFLLPLDFHNQGVLSIILLQSSVSACNSVKPTLCPAYVEGFGVTYVLSKSFSSIDETNSQPSTLAKFLR